MANGPFRPTLFYAIVALAAGPLSLGQPQASGGAENISPNTGTIKAVGGAGRACADPAATASPFVPRFGAWVGVLGSNPEGNSFGFTEGAGLRNGDSDE